MSPSRQSLTDWLRGWTPGPLFYYDLLCSSRRNSCFIQRLIYAVGLLVTVSLVYWQRFGDITSTRPLSPAELARFANSFFLGFLGLQLAAVFILTPVYTVGAIAEEKQRGRLDFLLTTELSSREIILGKLCSRLASMSLLLLTGLPVLGFMQFLGGVDPNLVLAGFAATGLTLFSVGSFGVWSSTLTSQASHALWSVYGVLLVFLLFCWCIPDSIVGHPLVFFTQMYETLQANEPSILPVLARYVLFHATVGASFIYFALGNLRRPSGPTFGKERAPAVLALAAVAQPPVADPLRRERPPIDDNPLLWKELYVDVEDHRGFKAELTGFATISTTIAGVFAGWTMLTAVLVALMNGVPVGEVTNPIVRGLGTLMGSLMLVGIALQAAGTICGEREQHTLDDLLMLPLEREQILTSKWLGSILVFRPLLIWLGMLWLLGVLTGGLHIAAFALLCLAGAIHVSFVAWLGIYLSIKLRTKTQAALRLLVTLCVIYVGGWLIESHLVATTPIATFWLLAFPSSAQRTADYDPAFGAPSFDSLFLVLGGLIAYGIAACVLWQLSIDALRAEKGPPPSVAPREP